MIEDFIKDYENKNVHPYWISSLELLTPNRFDLIFKILFLEYNIKASQFAIEIYKEHLDVLTSGKFTEYGNTQKSDFLSFLNDFKKIYSSILYKGFDKEKSIIPISNSQTILNGAHRLSICIFLGLDVFCKIYNLKDHLYDINFFLQRGIDKSFVDFGILKFLNLKSNYYLAIIWPSASKSIKFEHLLGEILYTKEVKFNALGAHNFLAQVYKDHKWIGDFENGYSGAITKQAEAFNNFSNVRCYFFKNDSFENVLQIKNQIRHLFGIGKASIHITDNKNETIDLANYILNENSIHFLNNAKPFKFKKAYNLLNSFNKQLVSNSINTDDILIDGGLVLSLYGIRDSNDLDYLSLNKIDFKDDYDYHISEVKYYKKDIGSLIYNPKFYFYFNGLKFISLPTLRFMKINRNQTKDKIDILLIDKVSKSSSFIFLKIKNSLVKFKFKFIAYLIPITKKLKIYNFSKYIYKLFN